MKKYPSDYLPLADRIDLINRLVKNLSADILTRTQVLSYSYNHQEKLFELVVKECRKSETTFRVKRLIIASGRFGPLDMPRNIPHQFLRLESGFRIEQSHEMAFFKNMSQLDPKLTLRSEDGRIEWRTFCACRNGETVLTETGNFWTVSGHSDGPFSGRSNIGFDTRILDEKLARLVAEPLFKNIRDRKSYFRTGIQGVLNENTDVAGMLRKIYGDLLYEIMVSGLKRLTEKYPVINHPQTLLIGPTLEGTGWYPALDGNLRIPAFPVWVAGDACGLFRGILQPSSADIMHLPVS